MTEKHSSNDAHSSAPLDPTHSRPGAPNDPPPQPHFDHRFIVRLGLNAAVILVTGLLLIVVLGISQRIGWLRSGTSADEDSQSAAAGMIYTCPMHPQIRQPNPGRCPICSMPLELATSDGAGSQDEYAVKVEPAARRLANIRTATVEKRPVVREIQSIGRIAIDESRQATISAYVAGRIERLFADYTGVEVSRGDHLAVIYSPELYAAQVEYLESRRALSDLNAATLTPVRRAQDRLVEGARERLIELGMADQQLKELDESQEAQSRTTIYAPIGGTVTRKLVVEGQYVDVGEPIYEIANLGTVWLLLQLFPEDAALVRYGQRVEVHVQSLPTRSFEGRVAFVDPVVDEKTRTVDVRVELSNQERLLRPGDYASATLRIPLGEEGQVFDADLAGKWISPMHPQIIRDEPGKCPICGMDLVPTSRYGYASAAIAQPEVLVVPRRAVLMTGNTSIVYVETEAGRFEIRPVKLGPLLRNDAVIADGVEAGEQVAVEGNFLIDSQMQLAGKPSLIDPDRITAKANSSKGPLQIPDNEAQPVAGELGSQLEELYKAYFVLVAALAADRVPTESETNAVLETAKVIRASSALPPTLKDPVSAIVDDVAHLHHMTLREAREKFKGISKAILQLASSARGEAATTPVIHFYCAMVPGGGGDWLQQNKPPSNPYWGSKMLRCVQHEMELVPPHLTTQSKSSGEN